MANVFSLGDAVFVVRAQLASANFPTGAARETARGLHERFVQAIVSVCGLVVTNPGAAPAAASLGDALGAQRAQLAAQTYPTAYLRQLALGWHDQMVAGLGSVGAAVNI